MSLDLAFVDWARTFDLSRRPAGIADFCDGSLFNELLAEIDPQWFKSRTPTDLGDNWVLKFNGLKKTYKLVTSYYEEVLGQTHIQVIAVPNLTAIARDDDTEEVLKFAQLIVTMAVQCEHNQKHIERIQELQPESQHALMLAIEQIMQKLSEAAANDAMALERPGSSAAVLADEKVLLESENTSLHDQLRALKAKYDDLAAEKRELQFGLKEMQQQQQISASSSSSGKDSSSPLAPSTADFILRSQIDNLKAE
ncbi:hypothetical protein HDU98_009918, partial [Podochytrium sp. JEL0797]